MVTFCVMKMTTDHKLLTSDKAFIWFIVMASTRKKKNRIVMELKNTAKPLQATLKLVHAILCPDISSRSPVCLRSSAINSFQFVDKKTKSKELLPWLFAIKRSTLTLWSKWENNCVAPPPPPLSPNAFEDCRSLLHSFSYIFNFWT